ncbi:uncharacterized protein LOC134529096 [Bacillus rossius redtenbacheri]|uniref:uncharacterized protein LOC134529096 n=1 Tax=Bacillus rossius redtenbacheri TaxID=93214 RepID=UPI002FDD555C
MTKTALCLLACLAAVCATADLQATGTTEDPSSPSPPLERDLDECRPVAGDTELYAGVVEKPYQLLQKVTADLMVNTGTAVVHCVRATNTNPDGHAARVTVSAGGLGSSSVTLHFESEWMRGIYYNVTVTGQ